MFFVAQCVNPNEENNAMEYKRRCEVHEQD